MFWFIAGIVLTLIALAVLLGIRAFNKAEETTRNPEPASFWWALIPGALAAVVFVLSLLYTQSVGQASVVINLGGTVASQNSEPGFAMKAPWQKLSRWDLFSQSVNYAGTEDKSPTFEGGRVHGSSVTAPVKGGAQADFDLSIVYSLDGEVVEELFRQYRTQERFTEQVVSQKILSVVRSVPTKYSPVEFRGEKRGEAQETMHQRLNDELNEYGIKVTVVNLQNVSFTADVEESIKAVEVAQQEMAKAEANLRAKEISARTQVVEAEAQAEANKILNDSLTDRLLQKQWIDAIRESGGTIVVPDGAAPLINLDQKAGK